MCTSAHYLGGFIGDDESKCDCLKYYRLIRKRNISTTRKTAGGIYPRKLCRSGTYDPIGLDIFTMYHKEYRIHIHNRREYYTGNLFAAHFLLKSKFLTKLVETLRKMLFKKVGLCLQGPVMYANEKIPSS